MVETEITEGDGKRAYSIKSEILVNAGVQSMPEQIRTGVKLSPILQKGAVPFAHLPFPPFLGGDGGRLGSRACFSRYSSFPQYWQAMAYLSISCSHP